MVTLRSMVRYRHRASVRITLVFRHRWHKRQLVKMGGHESTSLGNFALVRWWFGISRYAARKPMVCVIGRAITILAGNPLRSLAFCNGFAWRLCNRVAE